jgi:hypothetical protein
MLVPLSFTQARLGWQGRFTTFWRVYAEHTRLGVDTVAVLFFHAATLGYLTRRRVGAQFSTR